MPGLPQTPSSIFKAAIVEHPSEELRKGHTWHIGNVRQIDDSAFYFALGRTTSVIMDRYDAGRAEFVEEEFETAPYTHVVADTHQEVVAIAAKSKLSPSAQGIARQLARLLGASPTSRDCRCTFYVSAINDPADFIEQIRTAYSIRSFAVSFRRPNPFDVEEDFLKPMQRYAVETGADRGKTTISGPQLNEKVVEELARSVASTGDDADARIERREGENPVRRYLRGNPAVIEREALESDEDRHGLLADLREMYRRIRGRS